MYSFDLSHEDIQDREEWRQRISGEPANLHVPGKWPLKQCVCMCVLSLAIIHITT